MREIQGRVSVATSVVNYITGLEFRTLVYYMTLHHFQSLMVNFADTSGHAGENNKSCCLGDIMTFLFHRFHFLHPI